VKIKTRESLKTIKTFDRADTLAQKSKKGVSSLHNSAEQTQNVGYESETDYAGSELQDKEERIARMTVVGANQVGRWGVKGTRKNIQKWRNRPRKPKNDFKLKQLKTIQKTMLEMTKKAIISATKAVESSVKGIVSAQGDRPDHKIRTVLFTLPAEKPGPEAYAKLVDPDLHQAGRPEMSQLMHHNQDRQQQHCRQNR
jgi:hypothetical protein